MLIYSRDCGNYVCYTRFQEKIVLQEILSLTENDQFPFRINKYRIQIIHITICNRFVTTFNIFNVLYIRIFTLFINKTSIIYSSNFITVYVCSESKKK